MSETVKEILNICGIALIAVIALYIMYIIDSVIDAAWNNRTKGRR